MPLQYDSDSPLALAVRKAGSQLKFGQLVGKRQSLIHDWLRKGRPLPAEYVLTVEAATGISRHALRPDIYPLDQVPPSCTHQDGNLPVAAYPSAAGGTTDTDPLEGLRA